MINVKATVLHIISNEETNYTTLEFIKEYKKLQSFLHSTKNKLERLAVFQVRKKL